MKMLICMKALIWRIGKVKMLLKKEFRVQFRPVYVAYFLFRLINSGRFSFTLLGRGTRGGGGGICFVCLVAN